MVEWLPPRVANSCRTPASERHGSPACLLENCELELSLQPCNCTAIPMSVLSYFENKVNTFYKLQFVPKNPAFCTQDPNTTAELSSITEHPSDWMDQKRKEQILKVHCNPGPHHVA